MIAGPCVRAGVSWLCLAKREFCSRFLNSRPSPRPSPRERGEGEDLDETANPGFRLRSTLGYKYFAPSRAWAKQSAILISGFYVLVAASGSIVQGDRDIKGDGPSLVSFCGETGSSQENSSYPRRGALKAEFRDRN